MSRGTLDQSSERQLFTYRAVTLCGGPFQASSAKRQLLLRAVRNPVLTDGLGSFPFARRY